VALSDHGGRPGRHRVSPPALTVTRASLDRRRAGI